MKKTFCLLFIFSVFFAENLRAKINIGILKGMDSIPFAFLYSDAQENRKNWKILRFLRFQNFLMFLKK